MPLRQLAPDLFTWSRFQPERGYDFNGTALVTQDAVLLVDPVPATPPELDEIAGLGTRFFVILLNADHERDAATFAQRFSAPVHIAAPDAVSLRHVRGSMTFEDGHRFPGGWIAYVLPNMKTPGEAILHHPERRLVVAGDAVIGDPITGLRLVPPAKLTNRAGALGSLHALCELDFDGLILGDGFSLPSGGRETLRRFLTNQERS